MFTFRLVCRTPAQHRFIILITFLLFTLFSNAQEPAAPVYVSYSYIKTTPGKFDSYDSLLKTYSKKIVENGIKSGDFLQWSAYEVLSPTGSQADYDVVVVMVSSKFEMLLDPPGTVSELMAKNFPNLTQTQRSNVSKQFRDARTRVKDEIFVVMSTTSDNDGPPTTKPSKYITVDYMTPIAGKEGEYADMEIKTFKPIHKERIKLGATLGWAILRKLLPNDTNDPTPIVTVGFYDSFAGMLDGQYDAAVKTVYPSEDAGKVFDKMNTVKKAQRMEVWKLMVADGMQGVAAK